jgi:hypothetical protein
LPSRNDACDKKTKLLKNLVEKGCHKKEVTFVIVSGFQKALIENQTY